MQARFVKKTKNKTQDDTPQKYVKGRRPEYSIKKELLSLVKFGTHIPKFQVLQYKYKST